MSLRSAATAPTNINLNQFGSGAGARFIAPALSFVGKDAAIIGDHNGDGFTDYIIGAYGLNTAIIVMKRNTTNVEINLGTVVSGQYYRLIKGPAGLNTGCSVGGTGDINDDGFADVIVEPVVLPHPVGLRHDRSFHRYYSDH